MSDKSFHKVIASNLVEVSRLRDAIADLAVARNFSKGEVFAIRQAVDEALVNAVKHGSRMNPTKLVAVAGRISDDRLEVTIKDPGPGFNPKSVCNPLGRAGSHYPSSRGISLMRRHMSEVVYHRPGNKITLTKIRAKAGNI